MVGFVPAELFFTKGVGKHREKLTSFELAAPLGRYRCVQSCSRVQHFPARLPDSGASAGDAPTQAGSGDGSWSCRETATREPHRLIAATVGVAIPRDKELFGLSI